MSESAYRIGASFLREFFAGSDLVGNLIKNYPNRSVEELQMLESLRDTLDKFFQPMQSLFRKFDEHGGFPDSYLNNLKQLGLFGLIIPEKYGGLGLSAWGYGKVIEAVSYYDASTAVMLGAHSSIGLRGIIMYGSEEQKLKYLPSLASGDKIACFCLTEPESGSDAANLRTTAVKSGGDW
ncbi:MAG: acyl-CoA dehydrogenase family protein, partial [Deltaproteobacteria bacterium]|nr:acyl-CoA dehydrogenase family protein [Deltaproteobacteria bacterium]